MNHSMMTLPYRRTTLDNGLRVVTIPMPSMYSASVAIYLAVGSRFEDDGRAGSSHLLEHMLFKGTTRRPSAQIISETIEGTGGVLDASTGKEETACSARVAGVHVELAIDLLADMILHSLIEPAEMEKEKQVIIEELGMSLDSPQEWVHTLLDNIVWPDHPLGREIAGTRESVAGLNRAGLKTFHDTYYAPQSTVVGVAGNIDEEAVLAAIQTHFGAWRPGTPPQPMPAPRLQRSASRVYVDSRDTAQVNLCLATGGIDNHDPDRIAFDLLANIIGGGVSSRLFLEVRERQGLVYDIHTYSQRMSDTGTLVTYAGVDPENAGKVVAEIMRQLDRVRREPVGSVELERFKQNYVGRLLLGLEDTYSVAAWCAGQELVHGVVQSPVDIIATVDAITADTLQDLAGRLLTDDSLRLAAIGPLDDGDIATLEEQLRLS